MGRLSELRTHVNYELEMIPDPKTRTGAVAHLYGVSLAATMLAKKRGLDPELASMAAMLHDLWAYKRQLRGPRPPGRGAGAGDSGGPGPDLTRGDRGHLFRHLPPR